MPASSYQTGASSRTSPYAEYEEDEFIDLQFSEDPTQAYLSLGLTPLSQIDNYPASNNGNGGGSEGIGFFPSMPPPVSPMSSMFSLNSSIGNSSGIPADSPFNITSGGMVMPEALPMDMGVTSRRSRKGKLDPAGALSQGYAMTLETVPEQSGSLDVDNFNERYIGIITNGNADSNSSDSFEASDRDTLIFPSADNLSLTRHGGRRGKSGVRRSMDHLNGSSDNLSREMVFQNRDIDEDVDMPVRMDRHGSVSPSSDDKFIRQHAREQVKQKELNKQKELQRQRLIEDDRRRRSIQDPRAQVLSTSDYGATRTREAGSDLFHRMPSGHAVQYQRGTTYDQQQRRPSEQQMIGTGGIIKRSEQLTTL